MSVPNQAIIQEFDYAPCDVENIYAKINIEALRHAMQDLSSMNSLKLWLYLSKNKAGFSHLELSRIECTENWGLGKSQWTEAKETLINKGYLVPLKEDRKTGWYRFVQNPESGQKDTENPEAGKNEASQPESGKNVRNPEINKIPESGKKSQVKSPESGKERMISGLISPETVRERLQYYIDNINIDNNDDWPECREVSLKSALEMGSQLAAIGESWIYVITQTGKQIRFDKDKYIQDIAWSNMF